MAEPDPDVTVTAAPRPGTPRDPPGTPAPDSAPDPTPDEAIPDIDREHSRRKLKRALFDLDSKPLRIEHFVLLSRLGQGGMGVVYAAYDEHLDRKVAIKVMRAGHDGPPAHARMLQEARAMARITHPNIVTVHEVGEFGSQQIYIAMEFIRGRNLYEWLRARPRPWSEVVDALRSAGRGLAAAHAGDLIHRDFKPHNVMVGDDGAIKVLDFGLARRGVAPPSDGETLEPSSTRATDERLTREGSVVGTPTYMAPELHRGQPATPSSDQFAFCVALYYGLYRQHPFEGRGIPDLVEAIVGGRRRAPPEEVTVPAWLRRVVERGLSPDPADRHPSMAALLEALGRDVGARRRHRIGLGLGVVTLFGGGFAVAQLGERADAACPDAREGLRGAWDDPRRAAVAAALDASGSAHADDTWTRLRPALDDYAEGWVQAFDAACADRRSGRQSGMLYDHRVACLERARTGLQTLVRVLEGADVAVVDKAITAAAALPRLDRCADTDVLLADLAPPPDALADEVRDVRDRLAQAKAHEDAGRMEQALALADEAVERAEAVPYAPLLAEALLRRGSAQMNAGRAAPASESLAAATFGAVDAGHDRVAAEAAALRVYARSELLGEPDEATVELPWAEALVTRSDDLHLRGLFLNNAGAVYLRRGEPAAASASFQRALALRERLLPAAHPDLAMSRANLGRAALARGRYAEAAEELERALTSIEVSLGPRHPLRAQVTTILCAALAELGHWEQARRELEHASAIFREQRADGARSQYHVRVAQGDLARRQRRWDHARTRFEEALALAEPLVGAEHPMLSDARLGLAELEAATGDGVKGERRARDTVEGMEQGLGPEHPYVTQARITLGRVLLHAGRPDAAAAELERALTLERRAAPRDPTRIAWAQRWLGRARWMQGELDAAALALQGSLDAFGETLPRNNPLVVATALDLAELGLARGEHSAAIPRLEQVVASLEARREPADPELAWARFSLERARTEDRTADLDPTARARVRAIYKALEAEPGWRAEAQRVARWLEPPRAPSAAPQPAPRRAGSPPR